MLDIDSEVDSFLRQTHVAVLGTISTNGTPHLTPMWFTWDKGAAYMVTGRESVKWRNLQARPYASLCVDRRDHPYASVIVSGPTTQTNEPVYEVIRSMAIRYLGNNKGQDFADAYKHNPSSTVVFLLTPDHVVRNVEHI